MGTPPASPLGAPAPVLAESEAVKLETLVRAVVMAGVSLPPPAGFLRVATSARNGTKTHVALARIEPRLTKNPRNLLCTAGGIIGEYNVRIMPLR